MSDLPRLVLSLASFFLLQFGVHTPQPKHTNKSVAIVGAGSPGLGVLRAIVDLQDSNLDVILYEQRGDVGGIWYNISSPTSASHLMLFITQACRHATRLSACLARDSVVPQPPHQHPLAHNELPWFPLPARSASVCASRLRRRVPPGFRDALQP